MPKHIDQTLFAARALLPQGWRANVRIEIAGGSILAATPDAKAMPGDERHAVLLPAGFNLHSHAFQRGMAGLAERRGPRADTFWTWRETMYRFALTMNPDQVEAVAALAYVEMLEAGFCRVGEFHYLHHDRDGRPYANIAEMAQRIVAAAQATGIGLTLLPSFYAHASFGGAPPHDGQRRFICSLDSFGRLLEESRRVAAVLPGAVVGVAPHSLRAVAPEELSGVIALAGSGPIHIHAAEQVKEVEDCLAWSGARPVQWLLDHAAIDLRWCLIHATHMTEAETVGLARCGAVAGLCPITEANLGDGIFNGAAYIAASGSFGVGSDSNVLIGLADELRALEYAQRLGRRERNMMSLKEGSVGRALFDAALIGGAGALGAPAPGLLAGAPADIIALNVAHPALIAREDDFWLDSWIFSTPSRAVDCVWAAGRKRVSGGRHVAREAIEQRYQQAMTELMS